jgi:threonine/homoserine/homoserine lactone efflux protein
VTDLSGFFVAVFALLAPPGPTNALLAAAGATVGVRDWLRLLISELVGHAIAVGSLVVFVAPVMSDYPAA